MSVFSDVKITSHTSLDNFYATQFRLVASIGSETGYSTHMVSSELLNTMHPEEAKKMLAYSLVKPLIEDLRAELLDKVMEIFNASEKNAKIAQTLAKDYAVLDYSATDAAIASIVADAFKDGAEFEFKVQPPKAPDVACSINSLKKYAKKYASGGLLAFADVSDYQPYKPTIVGNGQGSAIVAAIKDLFPGVAGASARCPQMSDPMGACGVLPVTDQIVHLNDHHTWTREKIADWLDTLDIDLSVKTDNKKETK